MAEIPKEIVEQIMIRLDVKDLIRYRSVSKSWKSLISDPNFIKSHLEHGYRRDRENAKFGNRRIVISPLQCCDRHRPYEMDNFYFEGRERHLLGSSNGLVCASTSRTDYFVINPETREINKLKKPNFPVSGTLIYGFGYDASKDDYKMVLGLNNGWDSTCFKMFTLKSNTWETIGDTEYTCVTKIGILVNGSLHWIAYRGPTLNKQKVILSFDLSENKLMEIPQPDDKRYRFDVAVHATMRLGNIDNCLCVFRRDILPYNIWAMNNYGVKQSWDLVGPERKMKTEDVHRLKELKYYVPNKRSLCHEKWSVQSPEFLGSPLYMPSLVSPHFCRKQREKRLASSYKKTGKVPYLCLLQAGYISIGGYPEEVQHRHHPAF